MSPGEAGPLPRDADDEISALIETLHVSAQRLEELTAGEVDTVADREGRTFLLRHVQEHLRQSEAAKQAAILNALPAFIALLDPRGVILSVNETWREFASATGIQDPGHEVGLNYLEICERAVSEDAPEAHRVAAGIRSVLDGGSKSFSIEYTGHAPMEPRSFLLTVTPLADDRRNGAIVMHLDVTAERHAEERLRAGELRFRQIAENISEVFWLTDPAKNQVLYVSPAYEEIWGRSCENLYHSPSDWIDAIYREDRERVIQSLPKQASGEYAEEYRIVRPDGTIRWIRDRAFPVVRNEGDVYRIAGIAEDITESRRAADELHESQRRFSDLLGNVDMVSLMLDIDARITYCNDYLLRLTGWRREEVIGRDWFELFIPFGTHDVKDAFTSLLAELATVAHHENEILTRSGGRRLIQWNNTVLRSAVGEVIGTASIGLDITERKQAETRLRLQSVALNAAANAMVITERDLTIVWMNSAFTGLTGYTDEEAIGRNLRDLLSSGAHDAAFYQAIRDTILSGESWRGEITNRRKDGRLYPESSIITPVKDVDDVISHFISIKTDLTAQRQMEEQLRQAQKMEAVGQLAAGVAHEFNNLLQALMSMAAIIRMRAESASVAKIGTEMESQIRRGASLTQQLLLFSRHEAIAKSDLDLREELQKASVLLRRLIPENIRIVVELGPRFLAVEGDAGQMQQVILNLAINARDAMPAGGMLTLRTGSSQGELFVEVEDTGHGMDEATQSHIFEPFFTTKELGKGTGLGLAVVYGIVEQHGGRIDVQSRLGEGSRFRVILPEGSFQAVRCLERSGHPEMSAGSGRVLLVEDEEAVREGIAVLLEMIGYDVIMVGSGEEALALPLEPAPDLLLSDVTLPGIAGSALGTALRRRWPSLKVVLMSGYIEEALQANALEQGWHFLQKPFEMNDLARHIHEALAGRLPGSFQDCP
jgi:PAS domain S-box-containing protein